MIRLLVASGAKLNVRDERGVCALHAAARRARVRCAAELLEGGADAFAACDRARAGWTALHFACAAGADQVGARAVVGAPLPSPSDVARCARCARAAGADSRGGPTRHVAPSPSSV